MHFNLFHLMPYPYLPADFDEKYSTASLTIPNGLFDPAKGQELYKRYLDELEFAEKLGFEGPGQDIFETSKKQPAGKPATRQ